MTTNDDPDDAELVARDTPTSEDDTGDPAPDDDDDLSRGTDPDTDADDDDPEVDAV